MTPSRLWPIGPALSGTSGSVVSSGTSVASWVSTAVSAVVSVTASVRDDDGGYHTETYQEKVVTATATEIFHYNDVRLVGPVFDVSAFSRWKWRAFPSVFSARFFTVLADADTPVDIVRLPAQLGQDGIPSVEEVGIRASCGLSLPRGRIRLERSASSP